MVILCNLCLCEITSGGFIPKLLSVSNNFTKAVKVFDEEKRKSMASFPTKMALRIDV